MKTKPLVVGTDCSGIDAPIWALEKLRVPYVYAFASDIDPNSHEVIMSQRRKRMHPQKMYSDMTKRDHSLLPHLDVYVSGFPCQPFSAYGSRKGHQDPRAAVMEAVLKTIRSTRPKVFVLENVAALADQERMFEPVRKNLCEFDEEYDIHMGTLQSEDYGLPQRRNRFYILGVKRSEKKKCHLIRWPPQSRRTHRQPTIDKILLSPEEEAEIPEAMYARPTNPTFSELIERIRTDGGDPDTESWVLASRLSRGFAHAVKAVSPTLTASHAMNMWVTDRARYLTPRELCRLQGFPDSFVHHPNRTTAGKQAGNSMSVNVVAAVLRTGLESIGRLKA